MRAGTTARAAAVAGGGVGAVAAAGYGVLIAEATLARRIIGHQFGDSGPGVDGWYEPPRESSGDTLSLVMMGDSGAAGLGVDSSADAPGALIATGLARASGRRVRLRSYAVIGARSRDLVDQLDELEADATEHGFPDVAFIVIGSNDITNQVRIPSAVGDLAHAVAQLRTWGVEVVLGTCPDLGTIRPVAQPLRLIARRLSRQLASSQTVAAVSAGARTVSLGDLLGPVFDANPETLFSADHFHPSAAGYARLAEAVLPSICAAVGVNSDTQALALTCVDPVALTTAATIAAERAGAEVTPTEVNGRKKGPRGTWAVIRRRSLDTWKDDLARVTGDEVGRTG